MLNAQRADEEAKGDGRQHDAIHDEGVGIHCKIVRGENCEGFGKFRINWQSAKLSQVFFFEKAEKRNLPVEAVLSLPGELERNSNDSVPPTVGSSTLVCLISKRFYFLSQKKVSVLSNSWQVL